MEKEVKIDDNEVLKRLGKSLVTKEGERVIVRVYQEEVNNVLENENISFEHKKEIFEKIKLLQLFSNTYLGPDRRGIMNSISYAKMIFEVKDETEFEEKMKVLESTLKVFENSAMRPFDTIKKQMEDAIKYRNARF